MTSRSRCGPQGTFPRSSSAKRPPERSETPRRADGPPPRRHFRFVHGPPATSGNGNATDAGHTRPSALNGPTGRQEPPGGTREAITGVLVERGSRPRWPGGAGRVQVLLPPNQAPGRNANDGWQRSPDSMAEVRTGALPFQRGSQHNGKSQHAALSSRWDSKSPSWTSRQRRSKDELDLSSLCLAASSTLNTSRRSGAARISPSRASHAQVARLVRCSGGWYARRASEPRPNAARGA